MPVAMSNNACSALVGAIDDVQTTATIGPEGIFFPQLLDGDWFWATISDDPVLTGQLPEIVRVTSISLEAGTGNYDLTIERGVDLSTDTPKAWGDTSNFQLLVTAEMLYDLVTGGVSLAGATSFILNSKHEIANYATAVEDNGFFLHMAPGVDDLIVDLHEIPATAEEDFRIVINKRTNTSDGAVVINAFGGQTINGLSSVTLGQQYASVILTYRAGEINWDAISLPNYAAVPDDGNIYGIVYGPEFVVVTEEAPEDGKHYVRLDGTWVEGVPEAPADGTGYVRKDGTWAPEDVGGGDTGGGLVPTGTVLPFAGIEVPGGFLICDGTAVGRSDYPELFAAIGTAYGAPDATTFKVPDLRGRNVRGVDNMGGAAANVYPGRNTLGSKGGAYQYTLALANMPAHNHGGATGAGGTHGHTGSTNSTGSHTHQVGSMYKIGDFNGDAGSQHWSVRAQTKTSTSAGGHSHSVSIGNAGNHAHSISTQGSGSAKQYASPFIDMNYIIKV